MPPSPRAAGAGTQNRAYALDALRGYAILTMVLSGLVPYGVLPAWMYHAQNPPPTHATDILLPGMTWVDLVFPFFLFAMGAAFPLAMRRRLDAGMTRLDAAASILKRGVLLGAFAIYHQHLIPWVIKNPPTAGTWAISLLGFGLLFPMMARLPDSWGKTRLWAVRIAGWGGAVVLLALLRYPDGSGFSIHRSNIILVVLTNMAVFGALLWLLTEKTPTARLLILLVLMALRPASHTQGWVRWIGDLTPIPWMVQARFLKYLFIVIPGTMVGDLLVEWMRSGNADMGRTRRWSGPRMAALLAVATAFIIVNVVGLQARWVNATVVTSAALFAVGALLVRQPGNSTESLFRTLFFWGGYWLLIGLVVEPFEGGIKKSNTTLSYFFVTTGLAIYALIAFSVITDAFGKPRWVSLLVQNGQNPMIAYVGAGNLVQPLLGLVGLDLVLQDLTPTAWLGFLRAVFLTLLVALAVRYFTIKKIYWRT